MVPETKGRSCGPTSGAIHLKEKALKENGYMRFTGTVHATVFEYFQCATPRKAKWFFKDGCFVCSGCDLACETDDPEGFQAFLIPPK